MGPPGSKRPPMKSVQCVQDGNGHSAFPGVRVLKSLLTTMLSASMSQVKWILLREPPQVKYKSPGTTLIRND